MFVVCCLLFVGSALCIDRTITTTRTNAKHQTIKKEQSNNKQQNSWQEFRKKNKNWCDFGQFATTVPEEFKPVLRSASRSRSPRAQALVSIKPCNTDDSGAGGLKQTDRLFCPTGHENPVGNQFCGKCGQQLNEPEIIGFSLDGGETIFCEEDTFREIVKSRVIKEEPGCEVYRQTEQQQQQQIPNTKQSRKNNQTTNNKQQAKRSFARKMIGIHSER